MTFRKMTNKEILFCGIFATILFFSGIFILEKDNVTAEETTYTSNELTMPRTNNFAAMEVADIEYISMTATSQPETEPNTHTTSDLSKKSVAADTPQAGMLTASGGVFNGPSGKETWYNLDMRYCVEHMRYLGFDAVRYPEWIRDDGCKMLGDYIMCAANLEVRPKGTIIETSRGQAIVVDTGAFARENITALDIATNW